MGGGGGGSSGPTAQQQQLETQQAITNANLNLEENDQRKAILNGMKGTRVFRGSALSRAMRGNTSGSTNPQTGAPSRTQVNVGSAPIFGGGIPSLVDQRESRASGATPSGGVGASGRGANAGGVRGGGSGRGVIP